MCFKQAQRSNSYLIAKNMIDAAFDFIRGEKIIVRIVNHYTRTRFVDY